MPAIRISRRPIEPHCSPETKPHFVSVTCEQSPSPFAEVFVQVIRMNQQLPAIVQALLQSQSRILEPAVIEKVGLSMRVCRPDNLRDSIGKRTKVCFTRSNSLLQLHLRMNVCGCAEPANVLLVLVKDWHSANNMPTCFSVSIDISCFVLQNPIFANRSPSLSQELF